ncbi:hypothetical protein [Spiroplasma endosymbiont of Dasysyrphus albostriatus]|uniref:hypothetical protein n=1 Tax=Spiroplasma endosymbiont of Dasysyrphus albostriatus TaxID=3066299 RepID=UPI0030CE255D
MNKEKLFSYKDQEIINEYNKKRNQEITEEHLNNIKKIREEFKKDVINEYKEKLINFIITTRKENKESDSSNLFKIGKESGLFNLQIYINEGDFDNE